MLLWRGVSHEARGGVGEALSREGMHWGCIRKLGRFLPFPVPQCLLHLFFLLSSLVGSYIGAGVHAGHQREVTISGNDELCFRKFYPLFCVSLVFLFFLN